MSDKPTLNDLFDALHDRLACELGITRRTVRHNATMGAVSEDQWIKMLYEHLPKRYKVNRAFVIDSRGKCSKQIDIVIHDRQYSPFVLKYGGALYVPAESVYAVFDVKQTMSAETLRDTSEKVASVRGLHRTSVEFESNRGTERKFVDKGILGGILTLDSDWSPPLGQPLTSAINGLLREGRLDLGCIVAHGTFEAEYTDQDFVAINAQLTDAALALFVLRLIERLRLLGTAPAIDISEYAKNGIQSTRA